MTWCQVLTLLLTVGVGPRHTAAISAGVAQNQRCATPDGLLADCVPAVSCPYQDVRPGRCPSSLACCVRVNGGHRRHLPAAGGAASRHQQQTRPARVQPQQERLCTYVRPIPSSNEYGLDVRTGRRRRQIPSGRGRERRQLTSDRGREQRRQLTSDRGRERRQLTSDRGRERRQLPSGRGRERRQLFGGRGRGRRRGRLDRLLSRRRSQLFSRLQNTFRRPTARSGGGGASPGGSGGLTVINGHNANQQQRSALGLLGRLTGNGGRSFVPSFDDVFSRVSRPFSGASAQRPSFQVSRPARNRPSSSSSSFSPASPARYVAFSRPISAPTRNTYNPPIRNIYNPPVRNIYNPPIRNVYEPPRSTRYATYVAVCRT